ncbi:secretory carrier-associated membrane protein 5 [Lepeophtheirus salmonis]|uniref:Secretory carrier-associated membrane protein n=1 Tax=Lepeophtheirus salmonis TaxID=72036 RepID=C1BVU8_LEPSM|nr:secretory carrier-associated membrane protein 5-like isoform X2 [Lepeophtheirus salmonis]ACO13151.1 Secretory carrier-associated membrane protein 1 [Lepeophtheirus salmonis]ADD38907.1 Secretory carrier-associated membrane protein 1 [Lepeophtheirus salmonis]
MANPFASMEAENPFADPSIQSVTRDPKQVNESLEGYDPFANQTTPSSKNGGPSVMEEVVSVPEQPVPSYTRPESSYVTTQDLERRQEELDRMAKDLERREAELKNSPYRENQNNWPPLPSFCPIKPCFYQDINVDIPVNFQTIVRYLYYLWIWHVFLLLINVLVAFIYVFNDGDISTFGLALVYLVVFTPLSFICWFRPGYKAFRNDSSFNFMVFFFVFFFQVIVSVFNAIGIGQGTTGLITSIGLLQGNTGGKIFVGVFMLLIALGFTIAALADMYLLNKIYQLFKSSGGSVEKAQREFQDGVISNDQVRNMASDAVVSGFRDRFSGNGANNTNPPPQPDNRY